MKHTLEPYQASDRRVYNGANCNDMQNQENRTKFIHKKLLELLPSAFVTYFPVEGKYDVCDVDNAHQSIIPDLVYGKQEAMLEAIEILKQKAH